MQRTKVARQTCLGRGELPKFSSLELRIMNPQRLRLHTHLVVSDSCDAMDCSHQAPLSMGFSRQEHWNELPFPPPGELPDSGIKPVCLHLLNPPAMQEMQADSFTYKAIGEA